MVLHFMDPGARTRRSGGVMSVPAVVAQMSLIDDGWQAPDEDKDSWCTPAIIAELLAIMGPVALDPFWNDRALIQSAEHWDITHGDATFTETWRRNGITFANWPFSRNKDCARKAAYEGAGGAELITLCPAAVGSKWFQSTMMRAQRMCLPDGRLQFIGAPDPAPFDCALTYWGPRPDLFRDVFGRIGAVISPLDLRV